jgi:hypothetical protein
MTSQKIDYPGLTEDMDSRPDHGEQSYTGSGRLQGRVAVVTGGDSGIGRAVAIAFAREGADLVLSYLPEEESDGSDTAAVVRDAGRTAEPVPGDLRREEACVELIERTVNRFGRVDVLVSNAAHQMAQADGIAGISTDQLRRTVETNLYAMFWLCRAALPHMPEGGSIITTSSIQATKPSPSLLDYAMTKGAIVTFTKGLAQEAAERGIRVNSVAPGPIWTPLIPATMPGGAVESFGEDTPLGRAGQPAELAPAFVFLASEESSFITGEVLAVTGGKPL